jgi:hypothetical protein
VRFELAGDDANAGTLICLNGEVIFSLPELTAEAPVGFVRDVPPMVENTDAHATALAPLLDETDDRIEIVLPPGGPGEEAQEDVRGMETIFCLLALGDLAVASPASQVVPLCVKDGLARMGNPSDRAVGPDNSKLHFGGSLFLLEIPQVVPERTPIIGMHDFLDKMGILKKSLRRVTGDPLAGRRDVEKLSLRVHPPFPIVSVVGNGPVLDPGFTEGSVRPIPSGSDFRSPGFRLTSALHSDFSRPVIFHFLVVLHASIPSKMPILA